MQVAIVEDDPLIAKAVSTAIRDAGHECRWIADGDSAIRDGALLASDLVVLDLMLPGTDGLDVLRAARADARNRADGPRAHARQDPGLRGGRR